MNYAAVLASIAAIHLLAMLSPGPNVLVVAQTAIGCTRRAGVFAALGIAAGAGVWSSAALLGLSLLFAHFAWLYSGLKLVGGLYLLYLGIQLWRTAGRDIVSHLHGGAASQTDWQAFRQGLLTNLTNPKALIFYGSVLGALLAPELPVWVKAAAIGLIIANSTGWYVAPAFLFSTRRAQRAYQRTKRGIGRAAGVALALLGIRLLLLSY